VRQVLLKNDSTNPTGSFKDRQVSVGISHAKEMGSDTVAVVSSGNVAAAASAYAARADMKAILLMHGQAGPTKIAQASAYGATVIQVSSPKPSEVFDLCLEACRERGWYHLSTAGIYEPYNVEGSKTIAYEIYQQTGGDLPDWILAPVGGGGLLGGVWRGFLDLQRMGLIDKIPRMVGVQARGCAPLIQAIQNGWSFEESRNHPWPNPQTIAGGIADDVLFDGHTAIPAIRETGGRAIAVTDKEIMEGLRLLASTEGVLCELCSATTIAALRRIDGLNQSSKVCCLITGNGIKDLEMLTRDDPKVDRISCSIGELIKVIEGTDRSH
ncbi:MAG: threonine synthase, partial [Candidatus Omnitrophica bacterium]|nr:threonine synthase [Candidatus Omnitrophota bacterium]